ncbi:hypothetical protein [Sphingomonas sp. 28-62-11]
MSAETASQPWFELSVKRMVDVPATWFGGHGSIALSSGGVPTPGAPK